MFISILYESNFHSVFPRKDLPRLKDVANVINLCDKKVTKHMVSALILLEFNSIPYKYYAKSETNELLTIHLE